MESLGRKSWHSWIHASWYNYENNHQDALCRFIYYFKSGLHVSGDVSAHHQKHLTVFTVFGSIHPSSCRLVSRMSYQLIQDNSQQQLGWTLPDTVKTVKCFWWWALTWNNKLICIVHLVVYFHRYAMSVCPYVRVSVPYLRMEQLGSHWTDLILEYSSKICPENSTFFKI